MGLGPMELVIILIVALLLFGGSRLAGIGKGVGRSIREFKEEVQGETKPEDQPANQPNQPPAPRHQDPAIENRRPDYPYQSRGSDVVDAEIVQPDFDERDRR